MMTVASDGLQPRQREAGFTLLEVIVALAILAFSLGGLYQILATVTERAGQAGRLVQARLLAQSILAAVGSEIPVKPGETSGDNEWGLRWRLRQQPYEVSSDWVRGPTTIVEVTVEVVWGPRQFPRSISISTLRLSGVAEP